MIMIANANADANDNDEDNDSTIIVLSIFSLNSFLWVAISPLKMHILLQNQSLNGYHGTESKDDTLREFYQKLSYFLMSGEHSNEEIMEEIERQISNLQHKVNVIYFCYNQRFWHTAVTNTLSKHKHNSNEHS